MPIIIGSNITSLRAQRELSQGTDALSRVFERLSSGQRINRASDDAAGLAIADSLRADSRIFSQAIRNANDGISMLAIQESALQAVSGITTRISELAEQSANGVYSTNQRLALDSEAQALWSEAIRIANTTKFNGINLLSGSPTDVQIQVGTNSGASSAVAIQTGSDLFQETSYEFNGTISFNGEYDVQGRAQPMALADFNRDGKLDAVVGGASGSDLSILFGNGDGSFKAAVVEYGNTNRAITVGDIDGDGDIDVGFNDSTNHFDILLNAGDGTFITLNGQTGGGTGHSYFVDTNSDNKQDWIHTNTGTDTISVLQGNGDGTFKLASTIATGTDLLFSAFGDFNEDGRTDILTTASPTDLIFFGNADGSFTVGTAIAQTANNTSAADINNDGHLDLIGNNTFSSTVTITFGNGDGTFKAGVAAFDDGTDGVPVIVDVNGDGNLDMYRASAGYTVLNLGNGDGSFKASMSVATGINITIDSSEAGVGDLNGDGIPDFAHTTYDSDGLAAVIAGSSLASSSVSFSLRTASDARTALDTFTTLQQRTSLEIGRIGASQSRLEVALRNNESARQSYLAAESRIRDADVALESSALVRQQILQKAATAVLAQANQQPALALTLLGGG